MFKPNKVFPNGVNKILIKLFILKQAQKLKNAHKLNNIRKVQINTIE